MSATSETLAIFLGVEGLAPWVLIAAGRLRTARRPRAGAAADEAPATPAPVQFTAADAIEALSKATRPAKPAVARSTGNPGLAAAAASRPRDGNGQFIRGTS